MVCWEPQGPRGRRERAAIDVYHYRIPATPQVSSPETPISSSSTEAVVPLVVLSKLTVLLAGTAPATSDDNATVTVIKRLNTARIGVAGCAQPQWPESKSNLRY
jgi:hypothetical protein